MNKAYLITCNDWPVTGRGPLPLPQPAHGGGWQPGEWVHQGPAGTPEPILVDDPTGWLEAHCVVWDAEWYGVAENTGGRIRPEYARVLKPSGWIFPQWWHATELFLWDIDRANFLSAVDVIPGLPLFDPEKHTGINAALEVAHREMMVDCFRLDAVGRTIHYMLNEIARRVRDRIYHTAVTRLYTLRLIDDLQRAWWYGIARHGITGQPRHPLHSRVLIARDVWLAGYAVVGGTGNSPVIYEPPYEDLVTVQPPLPKVRRLKPLRML